MLRQHTFRLDPRKRSARTIAGIPALRDDAFETHPVGCLQRSLTVARYLPRDLKSLRVFPRDVEESGAALIKRSVPEILAIEMQQVEGDKCRGRRLTGSKVDLERREIRHAILVHDDHLAIDHGGANFQAAQRIADAGYPIRPVEATARIEAHRALLDDGDHAVAVPFNLVRPLRA